MTSLFVCLSRLKASICLLQTCRILARTFRSLCPIPVILVIAISNFFVILISYYYSFQTYTALLNTGKYDSVKYSKVEDLRAQDEPPSEQVKTSTTGKKLEKWLSVC